MRIKNIPIDQINPAPYNPRIDLQPGDPEYDKLAKVMDEFDLVEPLVWNETTGNLVGGHQRLKILKARGDKQVKVSIVDLPPSKEKALNVALNKTGGDWDAVKLADLLMELDTGDFDMELTGFGEADIRRAVLPTKIEEDEVPEPPTDPVSKPGDLWLLGEHRMLCGDATVATDMEKVMGGGTYQLLVTDPPYGVSYADKNKFLNAIARGNRIQTPIEGDHKKPEEMATFWREVFTIVRTFAADGASYYVTGPQGGDLLLLLLQALSDSDFPLRHMLIWAKNNHVLGRCDYNYKHEPIIFGWVKGAHKFYGTSSETSLWEVNKPHQSKLHPTMKPVELFARAISNSSQPGDLVFDSFLGSGTTLIAAEQLGRKCYGMEISPAYCDVVVKRWENLTGKKAQLEKAV